MAAGLSACAAAMRTAAVSGASLRAERGDKSTSLAGRAWRRGEWLCGTGLGGASRGGGAEEAPDCHWSAERVCGEQTKAAVLLWMLFARKMHSMMPTRTSPLLSAAAWPWQMLAISSRPQEENMHSIVETKQCTASVAVLCQGGGWWERRGKRL